MKGIHLLIGFAWCAALAEIGGIEVKNTLEDVQSHGVDDVLEDNDGVFLAPRAAKSVLRVRRWNPKSLWGEEQEEESEEREDDHENIRKAKHVATCQRNCMGTWSGWSSCSVQCGRTGTRSRTRSPAPSQDCKAVVSRYACSGARSQIETCNRSCQNGGTLRSVDCSCPAGYYGSCCENRETCGHPGRPSSGSVSPAGSRHYYGTIAKYSCSDGYSLTGPATRTCSSNGQWSGTVPACMIKTCGNPGVPSHGSAIGSNFEFGRNVVFSCQTGFTLSGQETLTCGSDGKWNHAKPSCQIKQCPALDKPTHGQLIAPDRNFRTSVTFQCDQGYVMKGSSSRTCQASGQWSGIQPTCTPIECAALPPPSHGDIRPSSSGKVPLGTVVEFSCLPGYVLHGTTNRTCSGQFVTGFWTQSQPSCQPLDCGNPGVPKNGVREGSTYTYSNKVLFKCQPGYTIRGASEITCASSGQWNDSRPLCIACALNTFKVGLSSVTTCLYCPRNTHTIATASSSKTHCICNQGYSGLAGGPCEEILCPHLLPPSNARIGSCSRQPNSTCEIECNDGYVVSFGSELRQCLSGGTWAGSDLACQMCPTNTYKSSSILCSRCPDHSSASSAGSNLEACHCDAGYTGPPGGPCQDLDECKQNHGCEQSCVNTLGSYRCSCSIPGYVQSAHHPKSCLMKNSCPDMVPPANGGALCVQETATNTIRCQVKCNPGYEHILDTNIFEECGPNTGWLWSNELVDNPMLGCATALFEDITLGLEVAYFTEDCSSLTLAQQRRITQEFLDTLRSSGVCMSGGKVTCKVGDVDITCGSEEENDFSFFEEWDFESRKKRSTQSALVIKFKLSTLERSSLDCANSGANDDFSEVYLEECEARLLKSANSSIVSAASQVGIIFGSTPLSTDMQRRKHLSTAMTLSIEDFELRPMKGVKMGDMKIQCPQGMIHHHNKCVECPAGTYQAPGENTCELCPMGTHQSEPRQSECVPCPLRLNWVTKRGATSCDQAIELKIQPGGIFGPWNP